ncbi:MAG: hypothetical protein ACFFDX_16580 [Candidatus Odinarchaeota archaeon]
MDENEFEYNSLKGNTFFIKDQYKEKGKEYGIIRVNKKQIIALAESIDLMSVAPSISAKFSKRIERFILPRFMELNYIVYDKEFLLQDIGIEISKENQKDIIGALDYPNVIITLESKGYFINELKNILKNFKMHKQT